MKEIVRVKFVKLLDVEIIYHILDSAWISPIQVVLKNKGTTVIQSSLNELIMTQ